jgi:hypothetical protein
MKQIVKHWRTGFESDPRYVELQTQIASLNEEIASLSVGGFGRIIDRNLIGQRQAQIARLRDRRNELKATFLVSNEIEVPSGGEPSNMTRAV